MRCTCSTIRRRWTRSRGRRWTWNSAGADLTATIEAIYAVDPEHGATYFSVRTDRGDREFVMQQLHDNVLWFTPTHLLLIDVDGNRFEIPDTGKLDAKGLSQLRAAL